jgi:hypothetical protein
MLHKSEKSAAAALKEKRLPLVLAKQELEACGVHFFNDHEPRLICDNFLEALAAMETKGLASILPDFLIPDAPGNAFFQMRVPALESRVIHYRLAWNPRLLRLNPHAIRRRDLLAESLGAG